MQKFLLIFIIILFLTNCGEEKIYDIQYYIDHPNERNAKLTECKNNPGKKSNISNCRNAAEAEYKSMFKGNSMPTIR